MIFSYDKCCVCPRDIEVYLSAVFLCLAAALPHNAIFNIYYIKTDISLLYIITLILNPARRTRYIEINWPKKWFKPILVKIKKFWERYREEIISLSIIVPFSYDNLFKEVRELDTFNQIALSLQQIARSA